MFPFRLTFIFHSLILFVICLRKYSVFATFDTSLKVREKQITVVNAFRGCRIRVINFRGLAINFQLVNEPIMLIRYSSTCINKRLYPFELGSAYPALNWQNLSTCQDTTADYVKLPSRKVATKYVANTLSDKFQIKTKNRFCEANIYIQPPSELNSPQMYNQKWRWESVLKNPILIDTKLTYAVSKWKQNYLNTVPMISLLICNSKEDSICENQNDVKKWIAGIFYYFKLVTLSVSVLIWEYPSASLKTLCPYCDPCDSLKTIHLHTKLIPTSRKELHIILKESQELNPDPFSFRVVLIDNDYQFVDIQTQQDVLNYLQKYQISSTPRYMHFAADQHLTSLLLPKSANITFSVDHGKYYKKWKDIMVDACSPTKDVNSHPVFRPMISRHTSRSSILVSWIITLSNNSDSQARIPSLLDIGSSLLWSILDQSSSLFKTHNKTVKCSYYWCISCIPLSWLYLSTLYKGENVTRLTAEPPLIPFDTFEMLEKYHFTTYSIRLNMKTFGNAAYFNISELAKLHKQYGSVLSHEALPVVSELWYELMIWLRPSNLYELSLNFLKDEISNPMWKYINNTALLPDYGQGFAENVSTIVNFHMKLCNKSAIILQREEAITLHTVLKQLGKPSYYVKDKILEKFWGYKFVGYFPPKIILRAKYLFGTGIIEWWQKHVEYSFMLKTNANTNKSMLITDNKIGIIEKGDSKTAVVILSLIPGVGFLISFTVFICAETPIKKVLHKHCMAVCTNSSSAASKLFHDIRRFGFKYRAHVENVIIVNVPQKL